MSFFVCLLLGICQLSTCNCANILKLFDFPLARSIFLLFSLSLLVYMPCLQSQIQAQVLRNLVYSHAHVLANLSYSCLSSQVDFLALKL